MKVSYDYDSFYRSTKTVLLNTNYSLTTAYSWRQGTDSSHTSYMPSGQTETLKNAGGTALSTKTLNYTYDSLGNIETISEGGIQRQKYYYDSLNQLIREDNLDLNKTFVNSYDLGGNITSTKEYAYQTGAAVTGTPTATNTYTYGDSNWKDKLTAYNGNTISYDQIGNPTSYYNGFSFTWQKGRQLASATNGTATVSYTYNSDGYRTSKTVNGTTTDYTLEGSKVLIEKTGSDYVWFYYDAAGAPVAMATGSGPSLYIYRKNLQGDVTGIYSGSTGTLLVSYTYDAWGKVTATNVAGTTESATVLARNPYLYRGYRYDAETGLYYLNSRYYDPETGRFINADGFVSTGQWILGNNMFVYCGNNPVNMTDNEGQFWNTIIGAVAGAIVGGITAAIMGTDIAAGIVSGALNGAITGAAVDIAIATGGAGLVAFTLVTVVGGGGGGAVSSYVNQRMNGVSHKDVDWVSVGVDGFWGAASAALTFGVAGVGGPKAQTVKAIMKQSVRKIVKKASEDLSMSIVISAGTLLNAEKMKYLRRLNYVK